MSWRQRKQVFCNMKTDWKKIEREYISGVKPGELIEKYSLNKNTFNSQRTKGHWKEAKSISSQKVAEKIETKQADFINTIIERQADKWLKISKRVENKLKENTQSALVLNQLASTLEKVQKGLWTCYGIADKFGENTKEIILQVPKETENW